MTTKKGMTFKKLGFRFRILHLLEFTTPMEVGGFSVDIGEWNCFAAATGKPIKTRHIAAVEIRDWLFRKGVTYIYGEAARELVAQAKAEGVYFKGDPGKCENDRKVRKASTYHASASGNTWSGWATTSTSSTNDTTNWYSMAS